MADKTDKKQPADLVLSYTVHHAGKSAGREPLDEALEKGYRVVEVLSTPVSVGGGGTNIGNCVITVLLTYPEHYSAYCRTTPPPTPKPRPKAGTFGS